MSVYNSTFSGNKAYGKGDDICVGDGGKVQINGTNITSNTTHVYFAKSLSKTQVTGMKVICLTSATVVGFIAGVVTANPAVGIAVGAAVGAGLGAFTSAKIAEGTYDVNYNRLTNSIMLIAESAFSGAAGMEGYSSGILIIGHLVVEGIIEVRVIHDIVSLLFD